MKMKSKNILSSLFIACNIFFANAQEIKETPEIIKDSIITKQTDSLNDSLVQKHIIYKKFNENWNTDKVNAYRDSKVKFPFEISFTDSTYASPIPRKHVITSRYGWRRNRPHRGIDIDLITGDSVFSVLSGKVRYVGYSSGYGKTVVVRHYNGLETRYAHLSGYAVKENDTVKKGQVIAFGGSTGRSSGSHLHLELHYEGVAINPEYLFDFKNDFKIRAQNIWITQDWADALYHSCKRQTPLVLLDSHEKAVAHKKRKRTIYIVKSGDTLSGIAYRNHVPIARICKTNRIRRTSTLRIGQKLIL
ncbi:M23 family metallopeptidase [uncultured Tenacibaculum sp.]|uniref:M23 family metallopeptidase n=2 Tax=Tenacibaculum TaxID=104267 RepID=UPI0026154E8A|nr:M23 family metallopeptidase [uncultured Tenacibaculum sp.]